MSSDPNDWASDILLNNLSTSNDDNSDEENNNQVHGSSDNETWARWKADWECPAVSARNSSNRRGGRDKAEATHIRGSIPHARTMRDLVSI